MKEWEADRGRDPDRDADSDPDGETSAAILREQLTSALCVSIVVDHRDQGWADKKALDAVVSAALLTVLRRRCAKTYCAYDSHCHRLASQAGAVQKPRHSCKP